MARACLLTYPYLLNSSGSVDQYNCRYYVNIAVIRGHENGPIRSDVMSPQEAGQRVTVFWASHN